MKLYKYPKTYHLPWSDGISNDDKVLSSLAGFYGKKVVVTEKMDGENITLYSNYIHARSLDLRNHQSQNWVKNFWSSIKCKIPIGWRVCGENLYVKQSIHYTKLPSFFLGFSVWNEYNECLNWNDTIKIFKLIGIIPVPVLYIGDFSKDKIIFKIKQNPFKEGYIIRIFDSFDYSDFNKYVGKYVRKNYIVTDKCWLNKDIEKNQLSE